MTLTFALETGAQCRKIYTQIGMRVTSKVGNLHSEFGHARPLGSLVIRYVHDGRRDDGRTLETLIAPFPMGRGIITSNKYLVL